jgi:predicted metal-dependent HD superfamily phosphohydrolase
MVESRIQSEFLSITESLKPKWENLCQRLEVSSSDFNEIVSHYSEPHRFYHTLSHVNHCLEQLIPIKPSLYIPEAAELAIWFHDIVYIIGNNDNEEKSAQFAKIFCQKNISTQAFAHQVESHILATKHTYVSENTDSQYVADIDIVILGQPADIFSKYESQIYQEYSSIYSLSDYQKGRINFLKTLLTRPIYSTDYFKNKYEQSAKINIQKSIQNLEKSITSTQTS